METQLSVHGPVCGTDEAGRGPIAGPVVAAAVLFDPSNLPAGLNDSKKLSESRREELFQEILRNWHVAWSVASEGTILRENIRGASLLAIRQAVEALPVQPANALIDGNAVPDHMPCPATPIIKGDSRCVSIAAASIVAKVIRDRIMVQLDEVYTEYGLAQHKGYPTAFHLNQLARLGPCPAHRRAFKPVRALLERNSDSQS